MDHDDLVVTKILVVEDESIVALDVAHRLGYLGYEVVGHAHSGEEAVELAASLRPDLILMDIMLEGRLDGIDAAAIIRERHAIPIIYLTAYTDEDTMQRAKRTEPFGYILKPFEDRELHSTIEMAVYKHSVEMRLVEKEKLLSTTLAGLGEAVLSMDAQGLVSFMNPAAERMLGYVFDEARGKPVQSLMTLVAADEGRQMVRPATLQDLLVIQEQGICARLLDRQGRYVEFENTLSVVRDAKGRDKGHILVLRDVSQRHRAEETLRSTVEQLRRTLEETVNALGVTSEKRDPYTAGHQQRVAKLACDIARELGLPAEDISGLRVGGLLHDLGKIYIPAEILSKPARLTNMEMGIMKTHSEVGFEIVKSIPFPWPVAMMVLQHHERVDGSGYPYGLSGEDILPQSKILCVADVVEAMSSHRPYRPALGLEAALTEIETHRGKRYDSAAVDACLSLFRDKNYAMNA